MGSLDKANKVLFSGPDTFEQLVIIFWGKEVTEKINFNSLVKLSSTYVTPDMRHLLANIAWLG